MRSAKREVKNEEQTVGTGVSTVRKCGINSASVFCSAKSTFPHKGRLSVPEPAGETSEVVEGL